jgi:hypothetical protein
MECLVEESRSWKADMGIRNDLLKWIIGCGEIKSFQEA